VLNPRQRRVRLNAAARVQVQLVMEWMDRDVGDAVLSETQQLEVRTPSIGVSGCVCEHV